MNLGGAQWSGNNALLCPQEETVPFTTSKGFHFIIIINYD